MSYRVLRGGAEFTGLPVTEPAPGFVPPEVELARLRPAPPPAPGDAAVASAVDEQVVVLRCSSDGGPEDAPTDILVVVAPPGATTARALDDRGGQIASYPLADGVAVVPVPANLASVEVIGTGGEIVDERAPMDDVDWDD